MTEQKTRKRGWVKNAIIIFLAVMLVLVFFSNTIMNRSLPEVATQYTSTGQINAMIRGTGTAAANETFEVKLDQTRSVLSTHVRVGDEVESGQLLFRLKDGESDELGALREELDNKEYAYRLAMLDASLDDSSQTNRDVQRAREELQAAQEAFDKMTVIPAEDIDRVKARIGELKEQVVILQAILESAQKELDNYILQNPGAGADMEALRQALKNAENAQAEAYSELQPYKLLYGEYYDNLRKIAEELYNAQTGIRTYSAEAYMQALADWFGGRTAWAVPNTDGVFHADPEDDAVIVFTPVKKDTAGAPVRDENGDIVHDAIPYEIAKLAEAYQKIQPLQDKLNAAQEKYGEALTAYYEASGQAANNQTVRLEKARDNAKSNLEQVQSGLELQQGILEQYEAKNAEYTAAKQNLRTLGDSLDNLLYQQRQQGVSQSKTAMELERQRSAIEELKTKIGGLESGSELTTEVTAAVSGIVRSLNVSSGNKTDPNTPLATIEVPDRGYTLKMSVTNEQASKVAVGDSAEVTGYMWGANISAQLVSIRNDPDKHGEGKLLLFNLTGNVESGTQYSVSIGARSQYYDVIVPNSAIHEDTNGTYVFVVEAKSSPLGNRYFATRVNVNVLAKDDNNSAVSGNLSGWNSSVVTASPPLSNGMQVRLAENT